MPFVVRGNDPYQRFAEIDSAPFATEDEAIQALPIFRAFGFVHPEVVFVRASHRARVHPRRLPRRG